MKFTDTGIAQYTMTEVIYMAGVYDDDSDFVKDSKITAWIGKRKYRVISSGTATYQQELDQARADAIEILIIKEN